MIVVLTGAGISAESGLSTFRDAGGVWSQVRLEDVATPEGFARDPARVLDFYNSRRAGLVEVSPNPAHEALARLEAAGGVIVTQNVDDLHERGGATGVVHMHGELKKNLCGGCGHRWASQGPMSPEDRCPSCGGGPVRPDVVWFGEYPYHLDRIEELLSRATTFAAIGTSSQVWPAAGFVTMAREAGAHTVEINLEATDMSRVFDERIEGRASEVVPAWVEQILG